MMETGLQLTSESAKHEEEDRVETAERERNDVLVEDGRNEEHDQSGYDARPASTELVNIPVDVRVEPVVHHYVPRPVVGRIGGRIPPILQDCALN